MPAVFIKTKGEFKAKTDDKDQADTMEKSIGAGDLQLSMTFYMPSAVGIEISKEHIVEGDLQASRIDDITFKVCYDLTAKLPFNSRAMACFDAGSPLCIDGITSDYRNAPVVEGDGVEFADVETYKERFGKRLLFSGQIAKKKTELK